MTTSAHDAIQQCLALGQQIYATPYGLSNYSDLVEGYERQLISVVETSDPTDLINALHAHVGSMKGQPRHIQRLEKALFITRETGTRFATAWMVSDAD